MTESLTHFAWLAGFILACFTAATLLIVWRESSKREAAERDAAEALASTRIAWRPLNSETPRAFRAVHYSPPPARGRWRSSRRSLLAKADNAPEGVDNSTVSSPLARILASDLRRATFFTPEQFSTTWDDCYDITSRAPVASIAAPQWHHPLHGMLGAEEFFPIADKAGIASACFISWFRAALTTLPVRAARSSALYLPLPAAVAAWPDAPRVLRRICASTGTAPARITLCLDAPADYDIALALRAQGFGLALGGCRSITHAALQHLPLTAIIADASLTQNLHASPAAYAMVESMAALGKSLGLSLLATDVETPADAAALSAAGFTAASGVYFRQGREEHAA